MELTIFSNIMIFWGDDISLAKFQYRPALVNTILNLITTKRYITVFHNNNIQSKFLFGQQEHVNFIYSFTLPLKCQATYPRLKMNEKLEITQKHLNFGKKMKYFYMK